AAVLKVMYGELKRAKEKRQLGQMRRFYYMESEESELKDITADATLGALRTDQKNSGRLVRVVVRIGDYKQDSYFGEGMGAVEVMPTDNQELALRRQLWLATDKAYKAALTGFTEKQAALKKLESESDLVDFSREKPTQSVHDLAKPGVDMEKWRQMLRSTSDIFRSDSTLESSSAYLSFRVLNRYFVNTEGTITRSGKGVYTYVFSGSAQANDGMWLERSHGWVVTRPDELPKADEIQK